MKAIVHIGTEKTGTSSIQLFLRRNRKALEARGYHFLQSAGKTNNWALPAYCTEDSRFDDFDRFPEVETGMSLGEFRKDFLGRFDTELRSISRHVHTVVMSSEHFHSRLRTDNEMSNIRDLLSKYFDNIRIVCYIREQAETCASWYSTSMKSGSTLSFYDFVRRCRPESYYFNYHDMLSNWETHFGAGSMTVALFDSGRFLNGNLLDDFTSRINPGLVGQLDTAIHAVNESLKPMGQVLVRALNIALPVADNDAPGNALRGRCKDLVARHFTGKGQQIDYQRRVAIFESFAESNEKVRRRYFPDIDRLFPPPVEGPAQQARVERGFHSVVNEVFTTLEQDGGWPAGPEDYTRFWAAINRSLRDVIDVPEAVRSGGKEVILSEEDARALWRAAARAEWDLLPEAEKIMTIVRAVSPELPGSRLKLQEYRERLVAAEDKPEMEKFVITYHGNTDQLAREQSEEINQRFAKWALALDVPSGFHRVIPLSSTSTRSSADGTEEVAEPYMRAFTLFRAASFDEARVIARNCPHIEAGGYVEVYRLEDLSPDQSS